MCYFNPSSAGQVAVEVELLLQLQGLVARVGRSGPFAFRAAYVVMTYVQHPHQQQRGGWHGVRSRGGRPRQQRAGERAERAEPGAARPTPDLPLDAQAAHKSW